MTDGKSDEKVLKDDFTQLHTKLRRYCFDVITDYLVARGESDQKITKSDTLVLVMNLTVSVSEFMYFLIHHFIDEPALDYEFIKVKLINALSDAFKTINETQKANGVQNQGDPATLPESRIMVPDFVPKTIN